MSVFPKVPHMGWNEVEFCNGSSKLLEGVGEHSDFYFVHSYVIQPSDPTVIKGYTNYGMMVPAIIEKDNITVFQFHPEKSGAAGLKILENFVKL
jgi:glutamine amidotransferase